MFLNLINVCNIIAKIFIDKYNFSFIFVVMVKTFVQKKYGSSYKNILEPIKNIFPGSQKCYPGARKDNNNFMKVTIYHRLLTNYQL